MDGDRKTNRKTNRKANRKRQRDPENTLTCEILRIEKRKDNRRKTDRSKKYIELWEIKER